MELTMLFYWMIWIKLGWDDAHTFSVREIDLWLLLIISLLCFPIHPINPYTFGLITLFLVTIVLTEKMGSADRDVLLIMLLTRSFHEWCLILLISSCLSLIHALFTQRKVIPFLFFLSLGHFLNFCLKML
jgi:hypothetical protein